MDVLLGLALGFAALATGTLGLTVRAVRDRRWFGSARRATGTTLLATLSALFATLSVSTQGYRALTGEELALTITTVPTEPGAFQAFVEYPSGRDTTLAVRGDQLLVDARILKWHYFANVLGLETQYELDRLTGRYIDIADEQTLPRTVHDISEPKPVDLYDLLERYSLLRLLVDAEYGSATYLEVRRPARLEVRVSTTGLLIREVPLPDGVRRP